MSDFFSSVGVSPFNVSVGTGATPPLKLSVRTLGHAIEEALMGGYTRVDLETVLADELGLDWHQDDSPSEAESKRSLIAAYMNGWGVPQMAGLARRIVTELDITDGYLKELTELLATYDAGGGVAGATKNLIFAANGPKPQIVLRDAMNNDIEIIENAEYCLVYEDPVPAEGLRFSQLVTWWREREQLPESVTDRDAGLALHERLRTSLDSPAEQVVFDAYAARYRTSFDIPVLIPQVYLHYDPYDQRTRRGSSTGSPLARQRMDFLLLFSDRRRVVIEVDGKHHYASGEKASPELYAQMVAEDRRLRLAGYEVYRFGGAELFNGTSRSMVEKFFQQLAARMS
ncbi:hypothetical protein [Rhodococcus qingshengii]|uniref:hypothetical protein n=1 Tax=Rhodococcus qingshengii TaxID=334542 RepID=UPI0036D79AE9